MLHDNFVPDLQGNGLFFLEMNLISLPYYFWHYINIYKDILIAVKAYNLMADRTEEDKVLNNKRMELVGGSFVFSPIVI